MKNIFKAFVDAIYYRKYLKITKNNLEHAKKLKELEDLSTHASNLLSQDEYNGLIQKANAAKRDIEILKGFGDVIPPHKNPAIKKHKKTVKDSDEKRYKNDLASDYLNTRRRKLLGIKNTAGLQKIQEQMNSRITILEGEVGHYRNQGTQQPPAAQHIDNKPS